MTYIKLRPAGEVVLFGEVIIDKNVAAAIVPIVGTSVLAHNTHVHTILVIVEVIQLSRTHY